MKSYLSIFSDAAKLRDKGNAYILASLDRVGLKGIVPSHGDVMVQLFTKGACNMGDLARSVKRSKSTVTVLVDKLEKAGYVQKQCDPKDSREKGLELEPIFEEISEGLNRLISENLTEEEIKTLGRLIRKCVD